MIKQKHLLIVLIPAILLASFALLINIIEYQPLFPKVDEKVEAQKMTQLQIPIFPQDPIIGDKKSPITLVTFEDFGCASCKEQMYLLDQIREKYPNKIKIIWKGLPVNRFPYPSQLAHEYGFCLNQQNKFTDFYPLAFTNSDNLSPEVLPILAKNIEGVDMEKLNICLEGVSVKEYISKTENLGLVLHIQSVPTMFFNNKQIEHPTTVEGWELLLNL